MTSSLKIGAISGLIAGFVGGIVFTIFAGIAVSLGFFGPWGRPIIPNAYGANILTGIIFGIICGVIYSRVHSVIPGKGVSKGFFFGLILLLIVWIRKSTFTLAYGFYLDAAGDIFTGCFQFIAYGSILGLLFELLRSKYYPSKEELKIITYDMKSGVIPGAIAGIADGITASIANAFTSVTGLFGPQAMVGAPQEFRLDFWISQTGAHIWVNLVWGAVFGMIFARVYNLIPGKGVVKGLYYSLVMFLIASFQIASYWIGWGAFPLAVWSNFVGFFSTGIALGLVLGALYKKQ